MKIVGFGACMLRGYPLGEKYSFFSLLTDQMEKSSRVPIEKSIVPLDGVPLIRAIKYFESKILSLNPDVLILQFGNQDVSVQLGKYLRNKFKPVSVLEDVVSKNFKSQLDIKPYEVKLSISIMLFLKYAIGRAFNIGPTNGALEESANAVVKISKICNENRIKLVVLSSFPSNDFLHNLYGRYYAFMLNSLSTKHNYVFVDLHEILKRYDNSHILLSDGCHLSILGHKIVMQAVWDKSNTNEDK